MRKLLLLLLAFSLPAFGTLAQTICNPNANLVIFTNYDGGVLNINVDVNIPNLKIGICSYEAVTVNLSGTYVGNVTAVHYAGYNSNNNHCGTTIATTTINGAPSSAVTAIVFAPPAPTSNPNGYGSIICGYSCSTTTSQGGCNTVDQIEAYFANQFPGSTLRMHKAQYGCWTGTQAVSAGGTCCPTVAPNPLTVSTSTSTNPHCYSSCDGIAIAVASGGTPPYNFQWTGGPAAPTWGGRCPGTYSVTVTDAASGSATQTVTMIQPAQINTPLSQAACRQFAFNGITHTASGVFKDTLVSTQGCDSIITLTLTINNANKNITQSGATLTAAATAATYKWVYCDSSYKAVPGATGQTFTATTNGRYALIITQNGCTDTSECKTVSGLGVSGTRPAIPVRVYPSPVADVMTIEAPGLAQHSYQVTDETGRLVLSGRLQRTSNRVDMRPLPAGLYLLQIEGLPETIKVTKQ